MPTFDIVSEVDKQEVRNAVEQVNKEVSTRFDFKGSDARVEQTDYVLTVYADTEFQIDQVQDILNGRLTKRGVDVKCLDIAEPEKVSDRRGRLRSQSPTEKKLETRNQAVAEKIEERNKALAEKKAKSGG